jgi:hypothetical protein
MPPPEEYSGNLQDSLVDIRAWVGLNLCAPGVICPCCSQIAALRKRKLHSSMAAALILIDRFFRANPQQPWVHVEDHFKGLLEAPAALRGDFPKLQHWGFLVVNSSTNLFDSSNPHSGEYRITSAGEDFARNASRAPAWGWMYNKQFFPDADAPFINVHQALEQKFNYYELSGTAPPDSIGDIDALDVDPADPVGSA